MNTQIQNLWEEVRELSLGSSQVSHLQSPPTPLDFLRNFVCPNKPLLISNAVSHWPATTLWASTPYLLTALSSSTVSLHLTPTGKADSLTPSPSLSVFDIARVGESGFGEAVDGVFERGVGREGCLEEENDCFRSRCEDRVEKNSFDVVIESGVDREGCLEEENGCFRSGRDDHVEKDLFDEAIDHVVGREVEQVGDLKKGNDCVRSGYKGLGEGCEDHVSYPVVFESVNVEKNSFGEAIDEVVESEVKRKGCLEEKNDGFRSGYKGLGQDCEDHVSSLVFASAYVEKVPFDKALGEVLASSVTTRVGYLQQQNDCFRSEYKGLGKDCEDHVPWASEALGCLPEAVNLWVGNGLSETSFHKDHYENLYVVISGEKHFLLLPPTDVHRMYVKEYPAAQYNYSKDTGEFRLEFEDPVRHVPWCSVNPYPSELEKAKAPAEFPLYFNGPKPFEVTVKAGQMLYLPSMWFHHVRQTPDERGLTVAINYWYDMRFDIKYAYFNFLQSIHYSSRKKLLSCKVACKEGSEGESPYCDDEE